jgi:pimeloyl-ACP methyl ester carboxylesterase
MPSEPYFFGPNECQLFGIYSPPECINAHNGICVILCYPIGQEYIRCHRSYVVLAEKLCAAGIHVLRFDYRGTGDSFGQWESVCCVDWISDIDIAIDEMKQALGSTTIVLFGARLGASLACMAASHCADVQRLALWAPAIDGKNYCEEQRISQKKWEADAFAKRSRKKDTEWFGFAYSKRLIDSIKSINLNETIAGLQEKRLLHIGDSSHKARLKGLPADAFLPIRNNRFWHKSDDEETKSIIAAYEIEETVKWIMA